MIVKAMIWMQIGGGLEMRRVRRAPNQAAAISGYICSDVGPKTQMAARISGCQLRDENEAGACTDQRDLSGLHPPQRALQNIDTRLGRRDSTTGAHAAPAAFSATLRMLSARGGEKHRPVMAIIPLLLAHFLKTRQDPFDIRPTLTILAGEDVFQVSLVAVPAMSADFRQVHENGTQESRHGEGVGDGELIRTERDKARLKNPRWLWYGGRVGGHFECMKVGAVFRKRMHAEKLGPGPRHVGYGRIIQVEPQGHVNRQDREVTKTEQEPEQVTGARFVRRWGASAAQIGASEIPAIRVGNARQGPDKNGDVDGVYGGVGPGAYECRQDANFVTPDVDVCRTEVTKQGPFPRGRKGYRCRETEVQGFEGGESAEMFQRREIESVDLKKHDLRQPLDERGYVGRAFQTGGTALMVTVVTPDIFAPEG
ncbi:hypothetical protein DFH09DRAFT_1079341 [Mycena vulgaris]|nr:hypothetical protein DFH09DRAFT_1079341 [Mycena vulgaris]